MQQLLARVHALEPADRRWLLENASVAARDRLATLLGASTSSASVRPKSAPDVRQARCKAIAEASPKAVLETLKAEPFWVVTAIFQIESWPWAPAVREKLPAMRRPPATPSAAGAQSAVIAEALLRHFAERLKVSPATGPTAAPPVSAFEKLLQRFIAKGGTQGIGA